MNFEIDSPSLPLGEHHVQACLVLHSYDPSIQKYIFFLFSNTLIANEH